MKFLRLPGQDLGYLLKAVDVSGFAAKAKMIHTAQSVQDFCSPFGKIFSTSAGPIRGQFQHCVCASQEGHTGSGVFVKNGRSASLDKIPAHDHKDILVFGQFLGLFYLITMAFVKRIIFCNNSCNASHKKLPSLTFS